MTQKEKTIQILLSALERASIALNNFELSTSERNYESMLARRVINQVSEDRSA